jgi:phosphoserine phosphatase RsbU/P
VLRRVNTSLRDDFPPGRFVTLIYAVLNGEQHTLTFSSAGHLPPLMRRDGCCSSIPTEAGLPLGIFDSDFSETTVEMDPGSTILFYTDGIVETVDLAGNEYGEQAFRHPSDFVDRIREAGTSTMRKAGCL